jgi:hypothetical protein
MIEDLSFSNPPDIYHRLKYFALSYLTSRPNMKLNWSHENFRVLGIDFSLDLNCITDINFTKKIKEVKAILKSWQHRKPYLTSRSI